MFWTVTIRDEDGRALGVMVLSPKSFKTGSTGLFGTAKIVDLADGSRYQVQAQAIKIGSKASEPSEASAAPGAEVA